jgi:hypothetical protein
MGQIQIIYWQNSSDGVSSPDALMNAMPLVAPDFLCLTFPARAAEGTIARSTMKSWEGLY